MGFFDSIKKYLSPEIENIYCQSCGNELTQSGGDVTSSGKIYCHGYGGIETACAVKEIFEHGHSRIFDPITILFYNPAEIQNAVRKKELREFGNLEKVVQTASR